MHSFAYQTGGRWLFSKWRQQTFHFSLHFQVQKILIQIVDGSRSDNAVDRWQSSGLHPSVNRPNDYVSSYSTYCDLIIHQLFKFQLLKTLRKLADVERAGNGFWRPQNTFNWVSVGDQMGLACKVVTIRCHRLRSMERHPTRHFPVDQWRIEISSLHRFLL